MSGCKENLVLKCYYKYYFLKKLYLFSQPAENFLFSQLGEVCQLVTRCTFKVHILPAGKLKVHLNQHDILM